MFLSRGFKIGRISGIDINVDFSWIIIFGLFVFILGGVYLPAVVPEQSASAYWGIAILTTLLFFSSVLVHEMSHSIVARRSGIPISGITLFIFGGVSQMEDEPAKPWDEFKMAIAGPLASIAVAILFFGVALVVGQLGSALWLAAFTYLWFINVVLAVFNMLPGFPLDGGRVFRSILWGITGNLRRSTRVAAIVGQGFGWLFIVIGVGSLVYPPLRQFASIWFALIGWFLVSAARNSYQQMAIREELRHVPISEVMNDEVESVPIGTSVQALVTDYMLRLSASSFPVERDGEIVGTVNVDDVQRLPRGEWGSHIVSDIMHPLEDAEALHPDNDAWDAANRMAKTNQDRLVVTDHGHVEGVVTRNTIMRWLQTHTNLVRGQAQA
jgi:Zn-dependent protease